MTIAALGPFAGRHTVDVAELGADGLFLLEGPTGAGKSTLIDAIVFGLYGKVASDAASDDRLRSAFADPGDETFVDLVFEVSAGVFRVRRTPTYTRPRRRGPGTTTAQATARLWRLPAHWADLVAQGATAPGTPALAGACPAGTGTEDHLDVLDRIGEPLATRIDEVGHRVAGLVGLDRTQFVQTVVLPQGEFARFLRARPEDRRVLLQRIFGTQVYERLAERLAEMRRTGDRAVAAARADLLEATARLVGCARVADDTLGPAVADLVPTGLRDASDLVSGVHSLVEPLRTTCAAAASTTRTHAEQARGAADQAAAELGDHERLGARLAERDRLATRAAALAADGDAHDRRVAQLATARAAREVAPLLAQADAAAGTVASATSTALAAHDAAPRHVLATLAPLDAVSWHVLAGVAVARPGPGCAVLGVGDEQGSARTSTSVQAGRGDQSDDPFAMAQPGPGDEHAALTSVSLREVVEHGHTRADRWGAGTDPAGVVHHVVERLAVVHTEAVGQVAALDAPVRTEAGLHDATVAATALADEATQVTAALRVVDDQLAARPPARAQLAAQVAQAQVAAARTDAAERAVTQAHALVTALDDLASARTTLAGARQVLVSARHDAARAVDAEAALRRARIAGLAGELAAGLVEAAPCPVCGSTEHPAPAALATDHVDAATVDQAEAARRDRERDVAELAEAAARADERVTAIAATVGDQTPSGADDALTCAQVVLDACRQAAAQVTAGQAALVEFDTATHALDDQRQVLATRCTDLARAWEVAADRLARDEATVAAARGEHRSVAARQDAAALTVSATARLVDALRHLAGAWSHAAGCEAALAHALTARGLGCAGDARAAVLTDDDLAGLEQAVVDHEAARCHVADALAGLGDLPEDVTAQAQQVLTDTARARAAAARADAEAAEARAAVAAQVHADVTTAGEQVLVAANTLADTVAANAPVVRMAGLVSGQGADNARHLSLATYVLQRRFADVTAAANDRLTTMSDGRYALVPSQVKEDVSARTTGLAMRVVDHWTGTERDPRTLSGGEAFYVSLCLALGLADVVSAEAGGIALGTLFVDEGFGSLDEHVLDQVLTELGRLRAGGRTVAVVSHVETLKQAIADRIEVRITAEGPSTLRVVG